MVAPIYDWTGFYIGGNGGWGQSHSCLNFDGFGVLTSLTAAPRGPEVSSAARSAIVGRPANGCLAWKHRAIGRISATRASARFSIGIFATGLVSTRTKTDGIGLFTGQIGYAWNAALFYVKGGAAVTSNRFSVLETFTGIELASVSATRWGGTAGVGFEYGFSPNWSFGVEYNHLLMGDANNSFSGVNFGSAAVLNNRITQDVDMVTVRINYRFGGYGAPAPRDTDLALFRLLQQTRSAEMPAFLLEVTCLKNPSGPRPAHNRAAGKPLPIA